MPRFVVRSTIFITEAINRREEVARGLVALPVV
jgi:hypothetical protein